MTRVRSNKGQRVHRGKKSGTERPEINRKPRVRKGGERAEGRGNGSGGTVAQVHVGQHVQELNTLKQRPASLRTGGGLTVFCEREIWKITESMKALRPFPNCAHGIGG